MSGLVQPAGDASIDLGSDLTPAPAPSSALLTTPDHLLRLSSNLVVKPPLFLEVAEAEGERGSEKVREDRGWM